MLLQHLVQTQQYERQWYQRLVLHAPSLCQEEFYLILAVNNIVFFLCAPLVWCIWTQSMQMSTANESQSESRVLYQHSAYGTKLLHLPCDLRTDDLSMSNDLQPLSHAGQQPTNLNRCGTTTFMNPTQSPCKTAHFQQCGPASVPCHKPYKLWLQQGQVPMLCRLDQT